MFTYDPAMAVPCFPPGNYPATILDVVDAPSRKGLPMLTVTFDVVRGHQRRQVQGWIASPTSLYLLKELAAALDQLPAFEAAEFNPAEFVGSEVLAELGVIQTEMFGDQNIILHYHRVKPAGPSERKYERNPRSDHPSGMADIDIPF